MTYTPIERGSSDWDVPLNAALVDQDGRISTNATNIENNTATISSHSTAISANSTSINNINSSIATLDWQPQDHGLKAWTQDPAGCGSTGSILTAGTVYLCKVILRNAATISNLYIGITTAGSTLTAGQNAVGLYDTSGNKLVEGADQTTAFGTSGLKTIAVTPTALAAGAYYVAILSNGTTPPALMRGNGASASTLNVGFAASAGRFLDYSTGLTALPATITMASATTNASARWAAVN